MIKLKPPKYVKIAHNCYLIALVMSYSETQVVVKAIAKMLGIQYDGNRYANSKKCYGIMSYNTYYANYWSQCSNDDFRYVMCVGSVSGRSDVNRYNLFQLK